MDAYQSAGADEVIFALEQGCFSPLKAYGKDDLKAFVTLAHEKGLKAGVLMNRLFHENDIENACAVMRELCESGADSIIFADTGLAYEAMKQGFMNRLVYQPETMMTSSYDAKVWSETGVKAVMISNLLTKEEVIHMAEAADNTGLNIHGYQMMSVSARPLLSSYAITRGLHELKGREDLFLMEEKRDSLMPVYENDDSTMIFSDYIQESFDEISAFLTAGMKRFVIESWHMETQYILDTVAVYRALLDGTADDTMIQNYRQKYQNLPHSSGYYEQKTVR